MINYYINIGLTILPEYNDLLKNYIHNYTENIDEIIKQNNLFNNYVNIKNLFKQSYCCIKYEDLNNIIIEVLDKTIKCKVKEGPRKT